MVSSNLGKLGEQVTAQWLKGKGYQIVASRWRCRWGELDLVAYQGSCQAPFRDQLIFVEVKTRQSQNWDADGLLAVTANKQGKLYRTAEIFLSRHPQLASLGCRFDLALVKAQLRSSATQHQTLTPTVQLNQPVDYQGYQLTLTTYLEAIF